MKRLANTDGIVIDEVSMLSGPTLSVAEAISKRARGSKLPWGGLNVVAVGDFAQLPPVNPHSQKKEWAFLDPIWEESAFVPRVLTEVMRTKNEDFLNVLNFVRDGIVNESVEKFLASRVTVPAGEFNGTRLFARRDAVELHNLEKLKDIKGTQKNFETIFTGKLAEIERLKKNAPISEIIQLKVGALVMLRQNDPERRWVNGTLGTVRGMSDSMLTIRLLKGQDVEVGKTEFTLLDADGAIAASAKNFPVTLAWALTIHKMQGATLDSIMIDLRNLWEPGQAYVALSRVRSPANLFLEGWQAKAIFADPLVATFHKDLLSRLS